MQLSLRGRTLSWARMLGGERMERSILGWGTGKSKGPETVEDYGGRCHWHVEEGLAQTGLHGS